MINMHFAVRAYRDNNLFDLLMETSSSRNNSWTGLITIDVLWNVITRSVLHPFVTWLTPLCLRAIGYSSRHPHVLYTTIWAGIVSVVSLLALLDQSIADGMPRDVEWDDEVVVITGGSNGLGKVLVEMYAIRGRSVAVLDVQKPDEKVIADSEALSRENVKWYQCDVSKLEDVKAAAAQIEQDFGKATILINNAGILNALPLLSLTAQQVSASININLVGHFNTLQAFLPDMLKSKNGGTIVTVASVLGKLGGAHLTDYAASKAGLLAMHASLVAELKTTYHKEGGSKIRTILVTPGQLATNLFHGMKTPSNFFGPVVEPVELAREIVKAVETGLNSEISLPLYAQQIAWMDVLPPGLRLVARRLSGLDTAMADMQRRRTEIGKKSN